MDTSSITEHFRTYFKVVPARTPELLEKVFRIRYDVYCREFGYETENTYPDGLEYDNYDASALHCLIVHRSSGIGAGCVRMVLANNQPDFLLPMELFCGDSLTDPTLHPSQLPRLALAEGSRLAVHTQFRRRMGEKESPVGITTAESSVDEQRTFPLLSVALFYASAALMTLVKREHVFVMLEPRLARRAMALKIPFTQVGQLVDYHGSRAAYYVTVQRVLDNIQDDMQPLYQFIHDSLTKNYDLN